MEENKRV